MEQNNEMTAQQSLQIITETFNKSRKGILRNSAKYFLSGARCSPPSPWSSTCFGI